MSRTPLANTIMPTLNETPLSVQQPTSGIINDFFSNSKLANAEKSYQKYIIKPQQTSHTSHGVVYVAPLEGAATAPICRSLLLSCRMTSCESPFFTSADLIYGLKKGRPS